MSKITEKFRSKKKQSQRITDANIEERREEVIARGKKFKYPFQYAKHRLVIITVIIGVVALATFSIFGWLQLYKFQNMSDIVYRFTKVIPMPVAEVDGAQVRYSDYLMLYRSSIQAIENQQGKLTDSEEDTLVKNQYKRQALDSAIQYAYALKLADELDIKITDEQVEEVAREHRTVDGVERSDSAFQEIIFHNFGLSVNEYKRLLMLSLAKKEVSERIDTNATDLTKEVEKALATNNNDFAATAEEISNENVMVEETGGMVDSMNLDGGRATVAATLDKGAVSDPFVSKNGDGFYIVKLIDKSDTQVNYVSIFIRFTEFDNRIKAFAEDDKIHEYIKVD
ncbi:MAG: SurA N-terminal domain-containing protein [Candidatus Saccharimonadales bacterium]